MSGVKLDRTHRGKINIPSVDDPRGNICMTSTGNLHTKPIPTGGWSNRTPLFRDGDTLVPSFIASEWIVTDPTAAINAFSFTSKQASFGDKTIQYVSDGEELASALEDSEEKIIVLAEGSYALPGRVVTVTTTKIVIGCGATKSKIVLSAADDYYIHINQAHSTVFKELQIENDGSGGGSPSSLIKFTSCMAPKIEHCLLGSATQTPPTDNFIYISGGSGAEILCSLFQTNTSAPVTEYLIEADLSIGIVITGCGGGYIGCVDGSLRVSGCDSAIITGCFFSNNVAQTASTVTVVFDSDAAVFHNNCILNYKAYSSPSLFVTVHKDATAEDGLVGCRITNNYFEHSQTGDNSIGANLIHLWGDGCCFEGNYVKVRYHGIAEDLDQEPVPNKVVMYLQGRHNVIANNDFFTDYCRCALFVDGSGLLDHSVWSQGTGTRVIGNNFYGFTTEAKGSGYYGDRLDGTGIYLGAQEGVLPQQGVIASNTFFGGTYSTAINACSVDCHSTHSPPRRDETAQYWAITGNMIDADEAPDPDKRGICVDRISFSTIIGNVSIGDVVESTNATNEYGTSGSSPDGTNLSVAPAV